MPNLPELGYLQRPNWIEINLDGLRKNVELFRSRIPKTTRLLLPVKADAYGHGSLACSWAAVHSGVDWLGVAHVFEGVLLRQYGIRIPILVLGTSIPTDFPILAEFDLTPSIAEAELAFQFDLWLQERNLHHKAHLKVDTGMHRFGIPSSDLPLITQLMQLSHLKFEGLFSHLSTADMPGHPMTEVQIDRFKTLESALKISGHRPEICHLANSAGVLSHQGTCFDMVRPGIALYGYNPNGDYAPELGLTPVMRMKATIRQIREIPVGESVSYGQFWTAQAATRIATVAIGYGDGYMRGDVNQGVMLVHGVPCPILGRVCMDATMVDVTHVPQAKLGDPVEVIHGELYPEISLERIATRCHTISYEIATRVARRLFRMYWWNNRILRWDDLRVELGVPDFQESPR